MDCYIIFALPYDIFPLLWQKYILELELSLNRSMNDNVVGSLASYDVRSFSDYKTDISTFVDT